MSSPNRTVTKRVAYRGYELIYYSTHALQVVGEDTRFGRSGSMRLFSMSNVTNPETPTMEARYMDMVDVLLDLFELPQTRNDGLPRIPLTIDFAEDSHSTAFNTILDSDLTSPQKGAALISCVAHHIFRDSTDALKRVLVHLPELKGEAERWAWHEDYTGYLLMNWPDPHLASQRRETPRFTGINLYRTYLEVINFLESGEGTFAEWIQTAPELGLKSSIPYERLYLIEAWTTDSLPLKSVQGLTAEGFHTYFEFHSHLEPAEVRRKRIEWIKAGKKFAFAHSPYKSYNSRYPDAGWYLTEEELGSLQTWLDKHKDSALGELSNNTPLDYTLIYLVAELGEDRVEACLQEMMGQHNTRGNRISLRQALNGKQGRNLYNLLLPEIREIEPVLALPLAEINIRI